MGNIMVDCLSASGSAIDNRKSGLGRAIDTETEQNQSIPVDSWTATELRLC